MDFHGLQPARTLLVLCLLLTCVLSAARAQDAPADTSIAPPAATAASATDDLEAGGIVFKVQAGYGNGTYSFALPVPNAALARQGASNTGLAWQLAYNQSVIPVQVQIRHRFPSAFKGRVEVECRNSVSLVEAGGNPVLTIHRDVLVPPSVDFQVTMLPRVVPPVSPGSPVWLTVRLYQGDNEKPVSVERSYAYQLAPDFLYSLHLDAADAIVSDEINPGNEEQLKLRLSVPNYGPQDVDPIFLSMRHYLLPAPHRQLTGAPLGPRDFAFVIADLAALRQWSAEEQAALLTFLEAGGHLCLYNAPATESWQGLPLKEPGAVGRGVMLPVAGGFADARQAVKRWLTGELSEFVLLSGGSVRGFSFNEMQLPPDKRLSGQLDLAGLLGLYRPRRIQPPVVDNPAEPYVQPQWPPYEPGYLNPVYIYRESCRCAAREPWDFPQFSQPNSRYLNNSYFNLALQSQDSDEYTPPPPPLNQLARAPRRLPWQLYAALLPAALLGLLSLPRSRVHGLAYRLSISFLLLASMVWCGLLWYRQPAAEAREVSLSLLDLVAGSSGAIERRLTASTRSRPEGQDLVLPAEALLRRVAQNPAGDLEWGVSRPEGWRPALAELRISGGNPFVATSLEAVEQASELSGALSSEVTRSGDLIQVKLDTSGLPAGSSCLLQSPLGWQVVPSGNPGFKVQLRLPRLDPWPGAQRLKQWETIWERENSGWAQQLEMSSIGEQSRLLLAIQGQLAGGVETLPRLAWLGIMAQPLSGLAAADLASGRGQALLWVALPGGPEDKEDDIRFLRYSFPLEPAS